MSRCIRDWSQSAERAKARRENNMNKLKNQKMKKGLRETTAFT
jgi:hypothetical protein